MKREKLTDLDATEHWALALAHGCVRNDTPLEDLHCGSFPISEAGDYSDVKVVTPTREIPWNELSRISDVEMKGLMQHVVNNLFTALTHGFTGALGGAIYWDRPVDRLTTDWAFMLDRLPPGFMDAEPATQIVDVSGLEPDQIDTVRALVDRLRA